MPPLTPQTTDTEALQRDLFGSHSLMAPGDNRSGRLASLAQSYLGGYQNPAARLQDVRVKGTPESAAFGYRYYVMQADLQLYDLYDEMTRKNPVISAGLELVTSMVLARETRYEIDEDDPKAAEIRDLARAHLEITDTDFDFSQLRHDLISYGTRHGFSVNEVIWRPRDNYWGVVGYYHRPPGLFRFTDYGQILYPPTPATPGLNLTRGSEAEFLLADPLKFVLLRSAAPYSNPFGRSLIDNLQYLYQWTKDVTVAWVEYLEYNYPIVYANLVRGHWTNEDRDLIKGGLENVLRNSVAVFPEGVDISVVQRGLASSGGGTGGTSPFLAFIEWANRTMALQLIGSILTMFEPEHGSRAQAEVHGKTNQLRIRPLAESLASTINRSLLQPWLTFSFGVNAPRVTYVIDTDEAQEVADTVAILSELRKAGAKISIAQLQEWTGLRPVEKGEAYVGGIGEAIELGGRRFLPGQRTDGIDPEPIDDPIMAEDVAEDVAPSTKEKKSPPPNPGLTADHRHHDHAAPAFAESRVLDTELAAQTTLRDIADTIATDAKAAGAIALANALAPLRRLNPATPLTAANAPRIDFQLPEDELTNALTASTILALATTVQHAQPLLDQFAETHPHSSHSSAANHFEEDLPDSFEEAFEWFVSRGLLRRAQIESMALLLAFYTGELPDDLNQEIRDRVLALKNSIPVEITKRIQPLIASAIADGRTIGEFLEAMDELVDAGTIPQMDAYLEMVFRTETGLAYGEARDASYEDSSIDKFLWGYEFWNPADDRSEESHAAVNGVLVKKGSAADLASRPGPTWRYSCRCAKLPLMDGDPATAPYTETFGAASIMANVRRF